jgi:CBS domain-containing protein
VAVPHVGVGIYVRTVRYREVSGMSAEMVSTTARVAHVMTTRLVTVRPDESLVSAWELMARGDIHHLPVVVDGRCLAVIDDRIVAGALANPLARPRRCVADVMPARVHCVVAGTSVRRVAEMMRDERATAVPVVDEHMRLLGLVTDRDVVAAVADEIV